MANLLEVIQSASSDTRPLMLDRSDFESLQQRICLYCIGKDNRENIIKSIDEGPFKMGKFREKLAEGAEGALHLGPERDTVVVNLTPEEKGRFTKLINDMRNIKMTMPKMQLNSKFVNNMLPEWGRFVTVVKLNRGLKESNYDQLYAYLKQHEAHANENKMMLDRYNQHAIDPFALVSNVSPPQYQATLQNGNVVVQNVQGRQNRGQGNNVEGAVAAGYIAKNCTQPKRPHNSEYFKDKMLLMQAQENGVVFDEEQLLFIAGGQDNAFDADVDEPPVQDLALNVDNIFQADQCDAFVSDVDEAPIAQTMFMANLSSADPLYDEAGPSYDSDILSEVQDHDDYIDNVA
ncbi:hypothetical protein Tco_0378167, partial [Tanacetum coccineum]